MVDLFEPVSMKHLTAKQVPLFVEIPVNKSSAPFLVSGTKTWVWVERSANSIVRAAVRSEKTPKGLSTSIVAEVARVGRERKWESNFPYSKEGLKGALDYIQYYGIVDVDVLVSKKDEAFPDKGVTVHYVPSAWVPKGKAVVVPSDRSFLGVVGTIGETHWTAVIHNPSRGMAVLGDW
jgi:hypothetical protein